MEREIPMKNYIFVMIIFIITTVITLICVKNFNESKDYLGEDSLLKGVIAEVKFNEFSDYITDNPNVVIYAVDSGNAIDDDFEQKFKQYIIDEQLNSEIVCLQIKNEDLAEFNSDVTNKYFSQTLKKQGIKQIQLPNIIVVELGKVIDILYKDSKSIEIEDVKDFLMKNVISQ